MSDTQRKKGKKQGVMNVHQFLDIDASEDDIDEEISEVYSDDDREVDPLSKDRKFDRKSNKHQPGFIDLDSEEALNKYFNNQHNQHEQEIDDMEEQKFGVHPSHSDPKMFSVRCKLGKEKESVLSLLNKYVFFQNKVNGQLLIQSASFIDKFPGTIFVESYNEANVRRALQDLKSLTFGNKHKIQIVPIKEVVAIFRSDQSKDVEINENQWVRIKRGPYEGDLGQVISVDDSGKKAIIKLVPRLSKADENNVNNYKVMNQQKLRHNQKFFNPMEYSEVDTSKKGDTMYYIYQGNKYYEGFMHRQFTERDLILDTVIPKFDEVEMFTKCESNEQVKKEILKTTNRQILQEKQKQNRFENGDLVLVMQGDLKGIKGSVFGTDQKKVRVFFKGIFDEPVSFRPEQLQKYFKQGEQVKVIDGKHEGEEAVITKINENVASVILKESQEEIRVYVNDLILSQKVLDNKQIDNNYKKMDLLRIRSNTEAGMVIRVNRDSLEVLELDGEINLIKLFQVEQKINDRRLKVQNRYDQFVSIDSTVKIMNGNNQGKTGIVKSIYKDTLYLFDQEHQQSCGIFIDKSFNCFVLTPNINDKRNPNYKNKSKNNYLIGQLCIVLSGNYKGYEGICKDADDNEVKLELSSISRTLTFSKMIVCSKEQELKMDRNKYVFGDKTPNVYGGKSVYNPYATAQTPYNMNEVQSPAYGMASPGFNNV